MSRKSVTAVLEAADAHEDVADLEGSQVCKWRLPDRREQEGVFAQPDWEHVHREFARVGVILKLLNGEGRTNAL